MKLITTSFMVAGMLLLGGAVFKSTAPTKCSTVMKNDTVFVLTGDDSRIPYAMRIMNKNPDSTLYIIGTGAKVKYKRQKVRIEPNSKSTYQNALAIKKIAQAQGLNRIVLITSEDHFNRAKYLIEKELPEIEIANCPVPLTGIPVHKRLERWGIEYAKYIGTMLGIKE